MNTIRTTIVDGHVHVPVSDELPDGTEVVVQIVAAPTNVEFGMDESQWRTDAAAIKEWSEWLDSMEPVEFAKPDEFDRKFAEFNIQAVREQMSGDSQ